MNEAFSGLLGGRVLLVGVAARAVDLDAGVAGLVGELTEVPGLAAHGTGAVGQLAVLPGVVALRRLLSHGRFLPCRSLFGTGSFDPITPARPTRARIPPTTLRDVWDRRG